MIDFEVCLKPIEGDLPCGPDLLDQKRGGYLEDLGVLSEGGNSGGKKTDWKKVSRKISDQFKFTKHLRFAVDLTQACMYGNALKGLGEGLRLIKELLSQFFDSIHPLPYEDDQDDRIDEINLLGQNDIIEIVGSYLLVRGVAGKEFTVWDLESGLKSEDAEKQQFLQEARNTVGEDGDLVEETKTLVEIILSEVEELRVLCLEKFGKGEVDLSAINEQMKSIIDFLENTGGQGSAEPEDETQDLKNGEVMEVEQSAGLGSGQRELGDIRSRNDVVAVLQKIQAFYSRTEPTSPVPPMLDRVIKVIHMRDFSELIKEFDLFVDNSELRKVFNRPDDGV